MHIPNDSCRHSPETFVETFAEKSRMTKAIKNP